jgi:hypothetical protein
MRLMSPDLILALISSADLPPTGIAGGVPSSLLASGPETLPKAKLAQLSATHEASEADLSQRFIRRSSVMS